METEMTRRELMIASGGAAMAAVGGQARGTVQMWTPKKAMIFQDFQAQDKSIEDRFKIIRDLGFQGVESGPIHDRNEAQRMRRAAASASIRVHSIIYGGWGPPPPPPDPPRREWGPQNPGLTILNEPP